MSRNKALIRAIEEAGGPTELGRQLGVTSQAISQWERCPAERVIAVERATEGRVTRHELRPDLYPDESAASYTPQRATTPHEAAE